MLAPSRAPGLLFLEEGVLGEAAYSTMGDPKGEWYELAGLVGADVLCFGRGIGIPIGSVGGSIERKGNEEFA